MKMNRKNSTPIRKAPLAVLAIAAALQAGGSPIYAHEGHVHSKDYSSHWSEPIITSSIEQKLLSGYQDGSFRPEGSITRAELAVLLTNAFPGAEKKHTAALSDVRSGAWYESAVTQAVAEGYLSVNEHGAFRPNQPVTRAEASAAFASALHWQEAPADKLQEYKDLAFLPAGDAGKWLRQAASQGYIEASSDGYLLPHKPLTRSEAVFFLADANGTLPQNLQPPAFAAEQELTGTIVQSAKGFGLKVKVASGGSTVYPLSGDGASLAGTPAVAGIETGTATVTAVAGLVPGKLQVLKIAPDKSGLAVSALKELDGILIEGHHSGISDPTKHSKACLLMPSCASSGFGISVLQADGKYIYYKFDARGHQLAAVLIDSIEKETNIAIHVSGVIEGGTLHVAALAQDISAVDAAVLGDQEGTGSMKHMDETEETEHSNHH
ncbi:S-layer homology domain-containing protein [Paenibacillus sophorae]|uniref:S-layer homology domain-containing protein n=1 Tax=Paenibacillus sophorae TaxID=1333845 RepID=A0A1H8FNF2_9BACL|nr:S-layer homology domain-containing protein [Paenibacillus sophorae]QWU13932.1 S-layer homology domain-containing protein [Paenibacillus sophorae]SEN33341.1 S-layer homology domain-containing protein [Paenibacillus sophorae]